MIITRYLLVMDFERPKDRSREPQLKRPDDGSKKEMNLDRTRMYNIRTFLNIHELLGSTNNILKLHWFTNPVQKLSWFVKHSSSLLDYFRLPLKLGPRLYPQLEMFIRPKFSFIFYYIDHI